MSGSPVGLVYVEVGLDYEPYTRAQKNLLKSVQSTTLNVEKSYTDLGIKSSKTFDLMRAKINMAYDRIANDAKASAKDIIAAETAKNKKLQQLNDQQFGAQTSFITKLKKNWMAYSVAVYAIQRGLRAVKTEFTNFETALVDMGKVTDQPLDLIRRDIMSINPVLGDATSLVKGYYQTISAGVTDPTRALDLLTTAAKAARAAHVDQSEVIKALTKMMAGFSGEVKTAADASDLLFSIEKLGQTTVSELVPIIGDISTASREAGVSQYEMAAAMSQITLTAGGTSEAATQYKSILMGLMKPNEKLTGLIQNLGFTTSVAMVKQIGFANALQQIRGEAARTGVQIGKLFRSSEGMLGLAALSVEGFETYRQKIIEVGEGAGGAERAFNSWELTSEALDKELDANFSRLMIGLGGAIMPAFNEAIKGTNAALPTLSNLIIEATKNFTEFWQAAGLASAGVISWWDVIKGGEGSAAALDKFNMGLSQTAKIFKINETTKGFEIYKKADEEIKKVTASTEKLNKAVEKTPTKGVSNLKNKVTDLSVELQQAYGNWSAYGDAVEDFYTTTVEAKADKAVDIAAEKVEAEINLQKMLFESMSRQDDGYFRYKTSMLDKEKQKYIDLYGADSGEISLINEAFAQRYKDLQIEQMRASGDFFAGVAAYAEESQKDLITWGDVGYEVTKTFADQGASAMSDGFFSIIKGETVDWGNLWDSVLDSMLKKFTDMIAQMIMEWTMSGIAGLFSGQGLGGFSLSNLLGGGTPGTGGSNILSKLSGLLGGGSSTMTMGQLASQGGMSIEGLHAALGSAGFNVGSVGALSTMTTGTLASSAGLTIPELQAALGSATYSAGGASASGLGGMSGLAAGGGFLSIAMAPSILGPIIVPALQKLFQSWAGQDSPTTTEVLDAYQAGLTSVPNWPNWGNPQTLPDWKLMNLLESAAKSGFGSSLVTADFDSNDVKLLKSGMSWRKIISEALKEAKEEKLTALPEWDPNHPDYKSSSWMNQKGGVLTRNKMLFLPGMPGGEGAFLGGPGEGVVSLPGMNTLAQINDGTFIRELTKDIAMAGPGQEKEIIVHAHFYIDGNEIGYAVAKQARSNPQLIEAIRGAV